MISMIDAQDTTWMTLSALRQARRDWFTVNAVDSSVPGHAVASGHLVGTHPRFAPGSVIRGVFEFEASRALGPSIPIAWRLPNQVASIFLCQFPGRRCTSLMMVICCGRDCVGAQRKEPVVLVPYSPHQYTTKDELRASPRLCYTHIDLGHPLVLPALPKTDAQDAALPSGGEHTDQFASEASKYFETLPPVCDRSFKWRSAHRPHTYTQRSAPLVFAAPPPAGFVLPPYG